MKVIRGSDRPPRIRYTDNESPSGVLGCSGVPGAAAEQAPTPLRGPAQAAAAEAAGVSSRASGPPSTEDPHSTRGESEGAGHLRSR
jgi:hypothetical protein